MKQASGIWLLSLILCPPVVATDAGFPGRNVNVIGPPPAESGQLPDSGLRQQNEPSCAVNPENSLQICCGFNDYRGIDVPGLGDAWEGLACSRDGGNSWHSQLIPGHRADPDHALGLSFAADPNLVAAPGGLFYNYIAADRDHVGGLYMQRYAWRNRENGWPLRQVGGPSLISQGTNGRFIDKPHMHGWLDDDSSATVSMNWNDEEGPQSRTLPAGNLGLAAAVFVGNENNDGTKILYWNSSDWGETWDNPTKLTESKGVNSGINLAANGDTVCAVWRRFDDVNEANSILYACSNNRGRRFSKAKVIADICPFDLTTLNGVAPSPENIVSFRSNAFPVIAADGENFHVFWSDRGYAEASNFGAGCELLTTDENGEDAFNPSFGRIVHSALLAGERNWTTPTAIEDDPALQGHQLMPAAYGANGEVVVAWLDNRHDITRRFGIDLAIDKQLIVDFWATDENTGETAFYRHTVDVRSTRISAASTSTIPPSAKVSSYRRGVVNGVLDDMEFNLVNARMFQNGTAPFIGDYMSVIAANAVQDANGNWKNSNSVQRPGSATFHISWGDNRDIRGNAWGGTGFSAASTYTPVDPTISDGTEAVVDPDFDANNPSVQDPPNPEQDFCAAVAEEMRADQTRNQNVYSAAVYPAATLQAPGAIKLSGTGVTGELIQRAMPVVIQNRTGGISPRLFTLSLSNPDGSPLSLPVGVTASFSQFNPAIATVNVKVWPRSSAVRTVFVGSPLELPAIAVSASEVGCTGPDCVFSLITLNQDPLEFGGNLEQPNSGGSSIFAQELHDPTLLNPALLNPDLAILLLKEPTLLAALVDAGILDAGILTGADLLNSVLLTTEQRIAIATNPDLLNIALLTAANTEGLVFLIANPTLLDPTLLNRLPVNIAAENPTLLNPTLWILIAENPTLLNPTLLNPTLLNEGLADELLALVAANPTLLNPTLLNTLAENPTLLNTQLVSIIVPPVDSGALIANPTLLNSIVANPTLLNPTLLNPTLLNPALWDLIAANPTLLNPTLLNPTLLNELVENPTLLNNSLEIELLNLIVQNPTLLNPTLLNILVANPTLLNLTPSNLTLFNPTLLNTIVANPTLLNPTLLNPTLLNVLLLNFTTLNPTLLNPTLLNTALVELSFSNDVLNTDTIALIVANPTLLNPTLLNIMLTNPTLLNDVVANPTLLNPTLLNPTLLNPTLLNPTLLNTALAGDILNPDLLNAALLNPTLLNTLLNPTLLNPTLLNPTLLNPTLLNPTLLNPTLLNPTLLNPTLLNPTEANPTLLNTTLSYSQVENPDTANPTAEDGDSYLEVTWQVKNEGNTTTGYMTQPYVAGEESDFTGTQLIVSKPYLRSTTRDCVPVIESTNNVVVNIPNPTNQLPIENPDPTQAEAQDIASFWLAPGEVANVTMRVYGDEAVLQNFSTNRIGLYTNSEACNSGTTCDNKPFVSTIGDFQPPTLSGGISGVQPAVEGNALGGAIVTYEEPTAFDANDGVEVAVTCAFASGALFPVGSTDHSCSASDASGNVAEQDFTIVVVDTTAPAFDGDAPASQTLEADLPEAATFAFSVPTAQDIVEGLVAVSCESDTGVTFPITSLPLGAHTISCSTSDSAGNSASLEFTVTAEDSTAPMFKNIPADISDVQSNVPGGAVVTFSAPVASDDVWGDITSTCFPASESVFPLSVSAPYTPKTVICTATDGSNNSASTSFDVTVIDTVAPGIDPGTVPGDITVPATTAAGATVTYGTPTATDLNLAGISCIPAAGNFGFGDTPVVCTARDTSDNFSYASFTITVADTTAPSFDDLPLPTVIAEALTPTVTPVSYTLPAATDLIAGSDSTVTVGCLPASGSDFPIGDSTVTCTASDGSNERTADFTVQVIDRTPPVFDAQSLVDISVNATSASGATVNYDLPTATDLADASVAVSCEPAAGTQFPIATTIVTCTATDDAGLEDTGSFTVAVNVGIVWITPIEEPVNASIGPNLNLRWGYGISSNDLLNSRNFLNTKSGKSTQPIEIIYMGDDEFCNTDSPILVDIDAGKSSLRYSQGEWQLNWQTGQSLVVLDEETGVEEGLVAGCYIVNIPRGEPGELGAVIDTKTVILN